MDTREKWLKKAYEHFAEYGPEALRVQKIASELDVPRTTFYHHFYDLEDLVSQLLQRYLADVDYIIQIHRGQIKQLIPDLHIILAQHPWNLKFGRQLFLNRYNPVHNMIFLTAREKVNKVTIPLFIDYYHFNIPYSIAEDLWNSLSESWYSRLDPNDLSADSMQKLTEEIMETVMIFARTKLFTHLQE